ncbi:hypothetical protein [Lachnoclostridium sp. Marseille-P6806]|uniref:hypothetical protein n=1 Tax=Lachnoclostridium sp. Marseille-P6806 TaxID=2364793 RepID=UPI0013EF1329|nr:hypothetical protein [Lachnoclostridium sp. Marseille-P6806]
MEKDKADLGENRILRGEDGVYRWIYEFPLLKNPLILFMLWKILAFSLGGVWAFVTLLSLGDPGFWWVGFWSEAKGFALILAGLLALGFIAYLFYAAVMGGKYCVLFEMDEHRIVHTQLPGQFRRAKSLSAAVVLTGLAAGNVGAAGSGLLAGSRQSLSSEWCKVKRVVFCPGRNTIKLHAPFCRNQIYASDRDFEFVRRFVEEHCVNAEIHK